MLSLEIVETDEAWDQSLVNSSSNFLVNPSDEIVEELLANKHDFQEKSLSHFPVFNKEITRLRDEFLLHGIGFFIIKGTKFKDFNKSEMREFFRIISEGLGNLLVQNIKNEKLVIITDKGKSMKTGGRYHQTKEGGSYHTDSPQWDNVPDFVGLYCEQPATIGGSSKYVSAYKLHNFLLDFDANLLKILYDHFHFDKRGEYKNGESQTTFKPIFTYSDGSLSFRYLRDYIDAGHTKANLPLTDNQILILDKIDEFIHNEESSLSYDLERFDMTFFNNKRVIHGRTSFEDSENPDKKRLMIRSWVSQL